MKLSINWLREFVDLKGISAAEIAKKLTLHTCEVEEVIEKSANFQNVFAGKLISAKKHPDSDKLSIGTFDLGKNGEKQIIFGQVFPLTEGEIYLVALAGAKLASGIEIKNSEIRGEKSEGMVCTNQELGMKNDGFIRLQDENLVGKPATEIFAGFSDQIIDVDNKSLTHRPDLMGHRGIARELSAIFEANPLDPLSGEINNLPGNPANLAEKVEVDIQTDKCRRFCSARMSVVKVEPSNYETQIRLENLDTRAISNLVDITNLNLLGLGQPMHIFDADKIRGKIIVRQAKDGEKVVALDGETYELKSADIVIADEEKVLSIAGIMGGLESSVTKDTTDIIFESANFDPTSVRKTSQRLALRSKSSGRYEKSLDPEQCLPALLAAIKMTQTACPEAKLETDITDEYPIQNPAKILKLDPDYLRRHSGVDISEEEIARNLKSLGFEVKKDGKFLSVEVPSWRNTKDIEIAEDLNEEVVRMYGFDNIEAKLPELSITPPEKNKLRAQDWKIREILATKGFMEVYHSSFVGPQDIEFTEDEKKYVRIDNPSNDECELLRQTLISNFVRHLKPELRAHGEVNFFELGKTYHAPTNEVAKLALFSAKLKGATEKMFFEQKSHLLELFDSFGIPQNQIEFKPCKNFAIFCHPYRCADIFIGKELLGQISVIHPEKNSVKNSAIVFTELETQKLQNFAESYEKKFEEISSFPAVHRDISILIDRKTLVGDLMKISRENSEFLTEIELFDDFVDEKKFGKNLKNLAFHLIFKSREKTLEEGEIDHNFNNIMQAWAKKFGAKLRLEFDLENNKI